jgi:serine/alanine adding enzyme
LRHAVKEARRESLSVIPHDAGSADWDGFVAADSEATIAHVSGWQHILTEGLGIECQSFVAVDEQGGWRGVLPIARLRSRIFGHHLISMPFLNDGGPLGTETARVLLAQHALELAHGAKVKSIELRNRVPLEVSGLGSARPKVTVHLPLPATSEELWEKSFRSKLRSQIKRPIKEGMVARFGADQREPFYEVFARNMRDLGTPVHSRRFFEQIAVTLPENAIFGVVYLGDTPTAAGCGFLWKGEFEITWASSLREFNKFSPNMLLYWAFMEEVISRKATVFNFGRCTPEGPTHRFKQQWGGTDVPLPWSRWPAADTAPSEDSSSPFDLAIAAWQRLPLPVANRVGPILARQIPWF